MLLGDFIMYLLAVFIPIFLLVRYKVTKEDSFIDYIFGRGLVKYFIKGFSIVYVLTIIIANICLYFKKHSLNLDFLYYKLW